MNKNHIEEPTIEDIIEHLDGVLDKIRSTVMQEVCNNFIPRNMVLMLEMEPEHNTR
jgi:hypothetical protein